ncbi:uncharacterized protein LOC112638266 [Camponotus floridanus]|uniref:uncharacterized protein LOC112638266 n=1 Tax=Camponotus floridanus TaxID=104421 RepID=UPI000DC69DC8|nr:uncharacterized protein LOC112638266 [Camponotus floridanus]
MSAAKRRLVKLHAPARKNFPRRRVAVRGYDDLWQADIVEMRPYAGRNRGHNYILTVIDALSKYAWAVPLKRKSGDEIARALSSVTRASGRLPRNLQTDKGKEFYNAEVRRFIDRHGINHYSTYSVLKASIVERFNRTLKNDVEVLHAERNVQVARCAAASNIRVQRSQTSNHRDASDRRDARSSVETPVDSVQPPEDRRSGKISTERSRAPEVRRTNPATYLLKNSRGEPIAGGFYEHELQRVSDPDVYLVERVLRRKGDAVLVKWLGMDRSHDSWIDKADIL